MDEKQKTEEADKKTFQSETLTVHVERSPGCNVKLDITVTPKGSMAAYKKAVKTINKEVSLPGFRKGKAPQEMIIQNFSSHIDQEWKEILVQTAFSDAVKLINIYPMSEETIKKPDIKITDKESEANITIAFEHLPEVPEIATDKLQLKKVEKNEVTDKEIEESIEDIRIHHAVWEDVTDRPIEEGDYVDLDIIDNDNPEHVICKNTRFQVAEGKMGDWMRKLLIGKKAEETAAGMSERTPDMSPDAEFKSTNCKITINAVKKAVLPELNEELAKKVGVDTVEELNSRIKQNLNSQAEEEVRANLREQLETTLLETYPFDLPSSLVSREVNNRLTQIKQNLKKAGKTVDEIKESIQNVQTTLENEVKKDLQMFYLMRRTADNFNIQVTKDELVRALMMQMYSPAPGIDPSMDTDEMRTQIYINILTNKVQNFLVDRAKVE